MDTKTTEVAFTLRIPEDLALRIGIAAAKERKSRSRWIREALELVVRKVEASDA